MYVNQSIDKYDRKTEKYIVAYLDLLGIISRIRSIENQELAMNKLHNLYTFSMRLTEEIQIEEFKEIKFKIFSDNIIIAKKVSEESQQAVKDIRSLLHDKCMN